jgi:hypothetical protein
VTAESPSKFQLLSQLPWTNTRKVINNNYVYLCSFPFHHQHKLKVLENRVLSRIFVPKREEVRVNRRKVRSEEFHNLYFSPYIIRMVRSMRT